MVLDIKKEEFTAPALKSFLKFNGFEQSLGAWQLDALYVMRIDGTVVGLLDFNFDIFKTQRHCIRIHNIEVLKPYRKKYIGTNTIRLLFNMLYDNHYAITNILAEADKASLGFWVKLGGDFQESDNNSVKFTINISKRKFSNLFIGASSFEKIRRI